MQQLNSRQIGLITCNCKIETTGNTVVLKTGLWKTYQLYTSIYFGTKIIIGICEIPDSYGVYCLTLWLVGEFFSVQSFVNFELIRGFNFEESM